MARPTIQNLDDIVKAKQARKDQIAPERKKLTVEELLQFSVKPEVPFDQKKVSDELWDECLASHCYLGS